MESQMRPLVSVLVPTYQHAAYIAACLDGILAQRSDFALEILVGEDESTDGTREICQRYAERHPDRIRWGRHNCWSGGVVQAWRSGFGLDCHDRMMRV